MYGNEARAANQLESMAAGAVIGAGIGIANMAKQQTKQQPPVFEALESLTKTIERAHDEFNELAQRLQPAIGPVAVAMTQPDDAPEQPSSCALEGKIADERDRMAALARNIRLIREALCI